MQTCFKTQRISNDLYNKGDRNYLGIGNKSKLEQAKKEDTHGHLALRQNSQRGSVCRGRTRSLKNLSVMFQSNSLLPQFHMFTATKG
jgi:hypothetical protein